MIVHNRAELEMSSTVVTAGDLYSWSGMIHADASISMEDNKIVARWTTVCRDDSV